MKPYNSTSKWLISTLNSTKSLSNLLLFVSKRSAHFAENPFIITSNLVCLIESCRQTSLSWGALNNEFAQQNPWVEPIWACEQQSSTLIVLIKSFMRISLSLGAPELNINFINTILKETDQSKPRISIAKH